jgi:FkbM family methyltransferase
VPSARLARIPCGQDRTGQSGRPQHFAQSVNIRDKLVASTRSLLARRGIVLGRVPLGNRLDHALIRVLSTCRIDSVLDAGANKGQFARFLRDRCAWKGPISSFEPVHSNFVALSRAMDHDRAWQGFEMALGSESGRTVIRHLPDASHFDSLLPATEYGRHRFPALTSHFLEEPVTVQRLDAVIDNVVAPGSGKAMLLKVDAQGFDLEVLHGATDCLNRIASVQLELSALAAYEGTPTLGAAIEEVMALGFDPIGFFPVARDQGLRVVEFDGLFIRSP